MKKVSQGSDAEIAAAMAAIDEKVARFRMGDPQVRAEALREAKRLRELEDTARGRSGQSVNGLSERSRRR